MRDALRFQTNVPETVALAFDEGKPVQGRYGDQILYTLEDDRVTYVPLIVDAKRRELGIRKGEEFVICKREATEGTRRVIRWEVERLAEPAAPEFRQDPSAAAVQHGPSANNDVTAPAPTVQAVRAQTKLEDALKTVVAAIHAARQYAKEIGYEMPVFGPEDIRTMANTLIIEGRNGGSR